MQISITDQLAPWSRLDANFRTTSVTDTPRVSDEWHIYASVNLATIGSDNGLSPVRRQVTSWTNVDVLSIEPRRIIFREILIKIQISSLKKLYFKSDVCEMATILSPAQNVKLEF